MFKCLNKLLVGGFFAVSAIAGAAEIEYEMQDIGTLQTHSSQPIAINNQGQILGWYNIDGSSQGKHFFVRDKNGEFHEIPNVSNAINWRFLTDDGKAYGVVDGSNASILYVWDQCNGVVSLGNLPGKEIMCINNSGQVLIKMVAVEVNGRSIRRPAIWKEGQITHLHGLGGDLGIESDVSSGCDMNNKGEVVGQSVVTLVYKNNVYQQTHAVKWVNGQPVDLHREIPKSNYSSAISINDKGDVLLERESTFNHDKKYVLTSCGKIVNVVYSVAGHLNNRGCTRWADGVIDSDGKGLIANINSLTFKLQQDYDSIWGSVVNIININDENEIIASGRTVYGEQHAMFLTPKCSRK